MGRISYDRTDVHKVISDNAKMPFGFEQIGKKFTTLYLPDSDSIRITRELQKIGGVKVGVRAWAPGCFNIMLWHIPSGNIPAARDVLKKIYHFDDTTLVRVEVVYDLDNNVEVGDIFVDREHCRVYECSNIEHVKTGSGIVKYLFYADISDDEAGRRLIDAWNEYVTEFGTTP